MQTTLLSLPPANAQAPHANDLPKYLTQIVGNRPGELDEPRNLILEAIYVLTAAEAVRSKSTATALKVVGLLSASTLAAKAIGGKWSTSGSYDPLPDYLTLQELAKTKLPKLRGANHPISLLRTGIAGSIAALQDRPA